ncbi:MAG: HAD hydrolase-like protein [Pacificimonas sp.]
MPRPIIVFDLDGTLVDTAPDLAAAMTAVLAHYDREAVPTESVRDMVGHGARRTIEKGLALTGGGTGPMLDEGLPLFLDHYRANICVHSRPYDGVDAVLEQLSTDATLAICTNKPKSLADALIEELGWHARFAAILGADSLSVKKPDPQHLLETISQSRGDPTRAAMIGDSSSDMLAGQAAKVPTVLCTFGYLDKPVAELPHDAAITSWSELPAALRRVQPAIWSGDGAST